MFLPSTNLLLKVVMISVSAEEHGVDLGPLMELFQLVIDNPSYKPHHKNPCTKIHNAAVNI